MTYRTVLAFTVSALLWGADWPPISPEVWAMQEDPAHGVKGAVVLEQKLVFTVTAIQHLYRVRVLSEAGKGAAEIRGLLPESMEFEGRTVYRDGTVIGFNQLKDFHEKTESIPGYLDHPVKVLLPPGVTSDCVVELRWVDKVGFRIHSMMDSLPEKSRVLPDSLGASAEWPLGGPFKVLHATVEAASSFPWTLAVTRLKGKPLDLVESFGIRRFTFHDIPAWENPPFSTRSLAGLPSCNVWYQPFNLTGRFANNIPAYWDEAADTVIKRQFQTDLETGKHFDALAVELTKDLKADPFEKATALLMRLERRIRNVGQPTLQEVAESTRKEEKTPIDTNDVEVAVARGYTSKLGMAKLYLALARKAGLTPVLAFVKDRNWTLLRYHQPDVYQLQSVLVGIEAPPRQTLWLDPATRFAAPGLILPGYQGTDAIVVEPSFPKWKARKEVIPIQPAQWNASNYDYQLSAAEGSTRFTVKAGFAGYEDYHERREFLTLEPAEQDRKLKERLEQALPQTTIHQTKVRNAQDPDQNVEWEASGTHEVDLSDRIAIDPFPGMSSPLPLPQAWPERRTETILLDHLMVRTARCRFAVPEGYSVVPPTSMEKANGFGKVAWAWRVTKGEKGTQLEVRLRVEAGKLLAPPDAYAELKQFVEWVREAMSRQIVLERSRKP